MGFCLHQSLLPDTISIHSCLLFYRKDHKFPQEMSFLHLQFCMFSPPLSSFTHLPTSPALVLEPISSCYLEASLHHFTSFKFSVSPCHLMNALLPARLEHIFLYFTYQSGFPGLDLCPTTHWIGQPFPTGKKPLLSYTKPPCVHGIGSILPIVLFLFLH